MPAVLVPRPTTRFRGTGAPVFSDGVGSIRVLVGLSVRRLAETTAR